MSKISREPRRQACTDTVGPSHRSIGADVLRLLCAVLLSVKKRDTAVTWLQAGCFCLCAASVYSQHCLLCAKVSIAVEPGQDNPKIIKQFVATLIIAAISVICDTIIFSGSVSIILILIAAWFIEVFPELPTMAEWMYDLHSAAQIMVFAQQ